MKTVFCKTTVHTFLTKKNAYQLFVCSKDIHSIAVSLHLKKLKTNDIAALENEQQRGDIACMQLIRTRGDLGYDRYGHKLRFLETVHIFDNQTLQDVSALANVKTAHFVSCSSLEDVSPLRNARDLAFIQCSRLNVLGDDMSSVVHIVIGYCHSLTDFSALTNMSGSVSIRYSSLTDTTPFANCSSVELINCYELKNVRPLKNVPLLSFKDCDRITGPFFGMNCNRCISFFDCVNVNAIDGLQDVSGQLVLDGLPALTDLHCLLHFRGKEIVLSNCINIDMFQVRKIRTHCRVRVERRL